MYVCVCIQPSSPNPQPSNPPKQARRNCAPGPDSSFELIIVDRASTDRSYAAALSLVRLILYVKRIKIIMFLAMTFTIQHVFY